ncbi:MAG: tetratricopeptide repeat protein [Nitrospirota bacterium]|nr:tetratricopeptide repeat protein [Nitrospirota bacterium]
MLNTNDATRPRGTQSVGNRLLLTGLLILSVLFCAACGVKHVPVPPPDDEYKTLNDRSAVLINQGLYEDALEAVERSLAIKPDYSIAWNNKGVILLNLGRMEEALEAVDRAIEIDPLNAMAWSNKAMVYGNTNRMAEALQAMDRALLLEPANGLLLFNKACYQALSGDREGAINSLEKAIQQDSRIKPLAAREEDLKSLRDEPRFKKITQ